MADFGLGENYSIAKKKKRYVKKKVDYSKYKKQVKALYQAGHSSRSVASWLSNEIGISVSESTIKREYARQKVEAFHAMETLGLKGWAKGVERGDVRAVKLWYRNKLGTPLEEDDKDKDKEEDNNNIVVNVSLDKGGE